MSQQGEEEKGFRVSDRRRFSSEGKASEEKGKAEEGAGSTADAGKTNPSATQTGQDPADRPQQRELPPVNFATFVISLTSSVLIHLGLAEDPMTGSVNRDLALAKQSIDILGMLKEKTRGNLAEEESQLMEGILYDLRMRYVEEARKEKS
jgi:hypothetical protein